MSFGSNVHTKKFGRGRNPAKPWICLGCGYRNMAWRKECYMCEVDKEITDKIGDTDDKF